MSAKGRRRLSAFMTVYLNGRFPIRDREGVPLKAQSCGEVPSCRNPLRLSEGGSAGAARTAPHLPGDDLFYQLRLTQQPEGPQLRQDLTQIRDHNLLPPKLPRIPRIGLSPHHHLGQMETGPRPPAP